MRHASTIAAIIVAAAAVSAEAVTVGPDAFGYLATDEVTFAWEDIAVTGTRLLGSNDGDNFVSGSLGFDLPFYGATYDSVYFTANGLITFGQGNTQYTNVDLATTAPNVDVPTIAALWDDWKVNGGAPKGVYFEVRGTPGSRRAIIQWNDLVYETISESSVTFEAILYEATGDILLQYQDVLASTDGDGPFDNGLSATVGIRDTGGQTDGRNLQWSYNQAAITNEMAIRFSIIPEPVTMAGLMLGIGCLARYVGKRRM